MKNFKGRDIFVCFTIVYTSKFSSLHTIPTFIIDGSLEVVYMPAKLPTVSRYIQQFISPFSLTFPEVIDARKKSTESWRLLIMGHCQKMLLCFDKFTSRIALVCDIYRFVGFRRGPILALSLQFSIKREQYAKTVYT